jgi:ribosome-associated protein
MDSGRAQAVAVALERWYQPGTVRAVPEDRWLVVSRSCRIPLEELEWRFSASGGPGGQHANTSNTRAEVRFDVESSPSLGPRQRARLLERVGPFVRVVASDERSQTRNRDLAMQRLAARLAEGLRIETPRVATRPRPAAKRKRVDEKRRRGETKRLRARPADD